MKNYTGHPRVLISLARKFVLFVGIAIVGGCDVAPPADQTLPDIDALGPDQAEAIAGVSFPIPNDLSDVTYNGDLLFDDCPNCKPSQSSSTSSEVNTFFEKMLREGSRLGGRGWPTASGRLAYKWGGKDPTKFSPPSEYICTLSNDCCNEALYGLDCSGFVGLCARAGGLDVNLAFDGTNRQSDPEYWNRLLPPSWNVTMVKIPGPNKPSHWETGDLLIWKGHIGFAVTGRGGEFSLSGEGHIWNFSGSPEFSCEKNKLDTFGARAWPLSDYDKRGLIYLYTLRIQPNEQTTPPGGSETPPPPATQQWTYVDMNPPGAAGSGILSTTGTQHAGFAMFGANDDEHAYLWTGTQASGANLHPSGAIWSWASKTNGATQAGEAWFGSGPGRRAGNWSGSAGSWSPLAFPSGFTRASATDLATANDVVGYVENGSATQAIRWLGGSPSTLANPAGMTNSQAFGIVGSQIVGQAWNGSQSTAGIWTWSGSAYGWTNLLPSEAVSASIWGARGGQQAGSFTSSSGLIEQACIWSGSAGSVVNLHPTVAGVTRSVAWATTGSYQAGYATYGSNNDHAALWKGSKASYVDLHALLPGQFSFSRAEGIAQVGSVLYVVGYAVPTTGYQRAILWYGTAP